MKGKPNLVIHRVLKVYLNKEIKELDKKESKLFFKALCADHELEMEDIETVISEYTEINLYNKSLLRRFKNWVAKKLKIEPKRKDKGLPTALSKKPKKD